MLNIGVQIMEIRESISNLERLNIYDSSKEYLIFLKGRLTRAIDDIEKELEASHGT